jgi:hypothetical protein
MGLWILLGIAALLILFQVREHYVEISGPGNRPDKTAEWLSKIDAATPISGNDDDYLAVLQKFYDDIYLPARTSNPTVFIKDSQVKQFAEGISTPGIDKKALRDIITAGFAVERTGSAASREQEQIVKTGALAEFKGLNLQPKMGVDEVRTRTEVGYVPADMRKGTLPEGLYSPVEQQSTPRDEGIATDKYSRFFNVCKDEECAKNVL